ncbi:COP9 signalosome complex subunit 8-like isoform X2 [Artemia franciscana]
MESLSVDVIKEKLLMFEQMEYDADSLKNEEFYAHFLLCYLYNEDLCSAKFLWKRIPNDIKEKSSFLQSLWNIGKAMWKKDTVAFHIAIQAVEWPLSIASIISAIKERYRLETIRVISEAYSALPLSHFANNLGFSLKEATDLVNQRGWDLRKPDPELSVIYVYPKKIVEPSEKVPENADYLTLLTNFVSFLEN